MNEIFNAVARFENMTINDVEYELKTATTIDAQFEFESNPDRITHTNNGIIHQNLLSSRIIGIRHEEVFVLTHLTDPRIGANNQPVLSISTGIVLDPHMLNLPVLRRGFEKNGGKQDYLANNQDWH